MPPAIPNSAPVSPAVAANDDEHEEQADGVDPVCRDAGVGAPACRPRCAPGRAPRPASRAPSTRRRGRGPTRAWRGRGAQPRSWLSAGQPAPARAPCRRTRRSACDSKRAATPDCSASPRSVGRRGLPLTGGGELVAPLGQGRLDLTEELAGADELLPAGKHLAAQQRAVGHAVLDSINGVPVVCSGLQRRSAPAASAWSRIASASSAVRPDSEAMAPRRVWLTTTRARAGVAGERVEPRAGGDPWRQPGGSPRRVERRLGDGEDRRGGQPLLTEHRGEVGPDLVDGLAVRCGRARWRRRCPRSAAVRSRSHGTASA